MSDLRNKIIRLAHENPELRKDLLPLLNKTARRIDVVKPLMHMNGGFATFNYVHAGIRKWATIPEIAKGAKALENLVNGGKIKKAVEAVCQSYSKDGSRCVVSIDMNEVIVRPFEQGLILQTEVEIKYDAFPTDADFQPVKAQFTKDMQQALSSVR